MERLATSTPLVSLSPTVDAHQHFWNPAGAKAPWNYSWMQGPLAPLSQSFGPAELAPLMRAAGVSGSVFVQAQHHLEETRWALGLAAAHATILGVVGYVDLRSPQLEAQLDEFAASPWFKGVRHIVQDEPDDQFLLRPEVLCGLRTLARRGIPFDLLVQPRHLTILPQLAVALPDLAMVINHCAKPSIRAGDTADWHRQFRTLGRFPNLFCKISGLATEADWHHWTLEQLQPIFDTALIAFGPKRLMAGSDWPVSTLASSYVQTWDTCRQLIRALSPTEQTAILGGTATAFYGLKEKGNSPYHHGTP